MKSANYEITSVNDFLVLLRDLDNGVTITNSAYEVILDLEMKLPNGIGRKKVYYKDTAGQIDELVVKDGHFDGFAPCPTEFKKELERIFANE